MIQTDSDEDVIFVSEKSGSRVHTVPLDLAKLQILQRDIEQESLPKLPSTSYRIESLKSIPAKESMGEMKCKIKEETNEKDNVKKVEKSHLLKTENTTDTCTEEMMLDNSDCNNTKKKRKTRKNTSDCANEVINISDSEAAQEEGVSKKKKKKKKKKRLEDKDEAQTESVQTKVKEETRKPQKKKEKKEKKNSNVEIVNIEKVENIDTETLPNKKKKSEKAKKQSKVEATEEMGVKSKKKKIKPSAKEEVDTSANETKRKKSKKNKLNPPVNGVEMAKDEPIVIEDTEMISEVKKEKKKKKVHSKYEEDKSKDKKHKKAKSESVMNSVDVTANPEPKKKKVPKDKKPLLLECEVEEVAINTGKQKKRSKKMECEVDAGSKKKKIKIVKNEQADHEFQDSSHGEVVFLSEKAGNTDEVNINQERRQALQMEIDKASQPKKAANPSGFGQWSTAEFGSSETQQKFLRLMGGFKKGFQSTSSTGNANMALAKNAQQQLQQGLQGEFERAHSRHMDFSNRGAGLGFTATSKKFSIDVNATRSIRFDD